jgi:hypothetical protein
MNAARNRILTLFLTADAAKSRYPCLHRLARLPLEDPRRSGKHWERSWHREASRRPNDTKIVAGHGPLGNKADLTKARDMLITSRDRVQKVKSAGKLAQKAVAEKPFADLDPVWGKGVVNGDQWVQIVYLTL